MEIRLIGSSITLRSISLEDATFTADLRSDPRIFEFLSSSKSVSYAEQVRWIENFLAKKQGFYFVIENCKTEKKTGTISIYNLEKQSRRAEFGRYIALDSLSAIESEYLILKFAFEILCLDVVYCRTADLNTKVWKQHLSFGFKDCGFELLGEKNLLLRKQELHINDYETFDYSKIKRLLDRFTKI